MNRAGQDTGTGAEDDVEEMLKQILGSLDVIQTGVGKLEKSVDALKADVAGLIERVDGLEQGQQRLSVRVGAVEDGLHRVINRLGVLEEGQLAIQTVVKRIEEHQNDDVLTLLKRIDDNSYNRSYEIQTLNKRIFEAEVKVERLNDKNAG